MHDLNNSFFRFNWETLVRAQTQAHTDTAIVMQFLYSSGPPALCATLNQPGWLSSGPLTGGGKQETNAVFKDRKHVQMVQFSQYLLQK